MTVKKLLLNQRLYLGIVLLTALLCTACGAKVIRGASPIMRMTELSHEGDHINLQLSMRNLNGVDLDINNIDFRLAVNDNEDELMVYKGPVNTNIVANGTETWSVEVVESEASRELLESLEKGEIKSLPYTLKGSVSSKDDGKLRFEYEGHIYPLPGKPGHFR